MEGASSPQYQRAARGRRADVTDVAATTNRVPVALATTVDGWLTILPPPLSTSSSSPFADLGLDPRVLKALRRGRLRDPVADPGRDHPAPARRPRRRRPRPDRHRQDGGVRAADPVAPRPVARRSPRRSSSRPPVSSRCRSARRSRSTPPTCRGVHVLPVYGGQGYGVQLSALRRGVHVVVGTPGRIMDHLDKGTLDLSELRFLVLDEADEMLKMGFAEDVETILADTPDDKQVALFSATMPAQIRRISKKYLNDPAEITVKNKTTTAANITQRYLMVSYPQKVDALTRILEVENFEGMIVFVRTKNETETLAEKLRARGFSAMAINGDMRAGAARADRQPAQVGQARHPGRHRRRGPRPRRRADQPRRQLRHPHRHRVLRPPHRPHRPGRTQRRRDLVRHARASATCCKAIEKATRQPLTQMQLPDRRRRQRDPARPLRRRDHRGALATERVDVLPRRRRPLRRASTTCPRPTSPPPWRSSLQGETPLLLEPERPSARHEPRAPRPTASAAPARPRRPRRPRASKRPRGAPTARRWRRTASPSASATRSSPVRSSARSPTRAA